MRQDHEPYMRQALALAEEAAAAGEVPVGCVIVDETGQVLGRGRNRREEDHDPLSVGAGYARPLQACPEKPCRGGMYAARAAFTTKEPCNASTRCKALFISSSVSARTP